MSAADEERAAARLLDLVPSGHEVVARPGGDVELAVYVAPAHVAEVRAAFADVEIAVVAPGWAERWKDFHRSVTVAGVWIGPPWETPPAGVPTVVIDPGLAFGTGAHPTTRLCVELLARAERGSLLDVGCGSGVLSIAAARLGFGPITAVDNDPAALEAAERNAAANDVRIAVELVDASAGPLPRADVALANIALATVERAARAADCRTLVTSGYLDAELPALDRFVPVERLTLDGWAADSFRAHPGKGG